MKKLASVLIPALIISISSSAFAQDLSGDPSARDQLISTAEAAWGEKIDAKCVCDESIDPDASDFEKCANKYSKAIVSASKVFAKYLGASRDIKAALKSDVADQVQGCLDSFNADVTDPTDPTNDPTADPTPNPA